MKAFYGTWEANPSGFQCPWSWPEWGTFLRFQVWHVSFLSSKDLCSSYLIFSDRECPWYVLEHGGRMCMYTVICRCLQLPFCLSKVSGLCFRTCHFGYLFLRFQSKSYLVNTLKTLAEFFGTAVSPIPSVKSEVPIRKNYHKSWISLEYKGGGTKLTCEPCDWSCSDSLGGGRGCVGNL